MKSKTKLKKTDNPREYKISKRRVSLSCDICPPHRGENAGRKPKYGAQKPKSKNKRRQ